MDSCLCFVLFIVVEFFFLGLCFCVAFFVRFLVCLFPVFLFCCLLEMFCFCCFCVFCFVFFVCVVLFGFDVVWVYLLCFGWFSFFW